MKGTVKWFDTKKGYGFLTDSEGKEHFVHNSNIVMDGFRHLDEDDIVNFELGTGKDGREQAISVQPILTMKMVKDSLKEENLYVKEIKSNKMQPPTPSQTTAGFIPLTRSYRTSLTAGKHSVSPSRKDLLLMKSSLKF